ncbi:MAG TPA: alpha/beta fold hydrolase, partial [Alphaproteobacteria bacterium]|nr:alpha/beta fold hydrolase [Alphaproteobacteria bacterium]
MPVILLHGARVPGLASFDLPVEGGSLAADLARTGKRVFIMDARGYGRSMRPAAMADPAGGKPLVNSHEVVRDLGTVVAWVKQRTGRSQVALLGWATGGHWAGMYASLNPEQVSHLIMYNALYGAHAGHRTLGPGSDMADPQNRNRYNVARFGAYRLNTADSLLLSWDRSIPAEDKAQWRDPAIASAYQREALASDPDAPRHNPPAFRAPSGALEDSFYLASGRQLWDAASIMARVLIIRSSNDFWSRPEDVTKLQEHLGNAAAVKSVMIPDATHHVHLDRMNRGRGRFLAEIIAFLNEAPPAS